MMAEYDLIIAEDGAPSLELAGATVIDPNTRSGNPHHEVSTGRFGTGPGQTNRRQGDRRQPASSSQAVDDASVQRRRDAVVGAAREIQNLSDETAIRDFIRQRASGTRALTEDDIRSFIDDARRQRVDDVIDALDVRLKTNVLTRSKHVRVEFPRGWLRQSLRGLTSDEVSNVIMRLRTRGWTDNDIRKNITQRFEMAKPNASK